MSSTKYIEQQLKELRAAVLAMAISLDAALPSTREVISALDAIAETQWELDR